MQSFNPLTTLATIALTIGVLTTPTHGLAAGYHVTNGHMTYNPAGGTGACGLANTVDGMQLAFPAGLFGNYTNGADSPTCGKKVTITNGTVTVTATVFDKCMGCTNNWLDVSEAVFQMFAPEAQETVDPVSWTYHG